MALALRNRAILSPAEHLARIADPTLLFADAGEKPPHAHQVKALRNWRQDHMLLWTRQGGKSTTGAVLAAHNLLFNSDDQRPPTVVIVSRAERQSGETFLKTRTLLSKLPYAPPLTIDSATVIALAGGGRVLAYPGSEESVRGLSAVTLALIDEATLTPTELRNAISPMLSTTGGPIWSMATARGCSGWFFDDWHNTDLGFVVKSKVTHDQLDHISADYIAKERLRMPSWQFKQEYECEFIDDGEVVLISAAIIDAARNPEVHALW